MLNFIQKFIFLLKKPKVIIVAGNGRADTSEAVFRILNQHFKVGKEILIFQAEPNDTGVKKSYYLLKHSSLPVLVVTHVHEIPFGSRVSSAGEGNFFAGEKEEKEKTKEIRELSKAMPSHGYLILNFDDETVRKVKDEINLQALTFGFHEGVDFQATDVKLNGGDVSDSSVAESAARGTNFKINYKGNTVPVWLAPTPPHQKFWCRGEGVGKEQIYAALAAAAVGTVLGLNLVEVSQALKNYQGCNKSA